MSIATVITEGFGSFGNVPFVVLEGFGPYDPAPSASPNLLALLGVGD